MQVPTTDELIKFMEPIIKEFYSSQDFSLISSNSSFVTLINSFINDTNLKQLFISKNESLNFSLEAPSNCSSFILFQKNCTHLLQNHLHAQISILPIETSNLLSFLQTFTNKCVISTFKSNNFADSLTEIATRFSVELDRHSHEYLIPPFTFSFSNCNFQNDEQISSFVSNFISDVESLLVLCEFPPSFDFLIDELNLWAQLSKSEENLIKILTEFKQPQHQTLLNQITTLHSSFVKFLDSSLLKCNKTFPQISSISKALAAFKLPHFQEIDSLQMFEDKIKTGYNFLLPFFSQFPIEERRRVPHFHWVFSTFFADKLMEILIKLGLQHISIESFEKAITQVHNIQELWQRLDKNLLTSLKENNLQHEYLEKFSKNLNTQKRNKILNRLSDLEKVRIFIKDISPYLPDEKVQECYSIISNVSVFDFSVDNTAKWDTGLQEFNEHSLKLQSNVLNILQKELAECNILDSIYNFLTKNQTIFERGAFSELRLNAYSIFNQQMEIELKKLQNNLDELEKLQTNSKSDIEQYFLIKGFCPNSSRQFALQSIRYRLSLFEKMIKSIYCEIPENLYLIITQIKPFIDKAISNIAIQSLVQQMSSINTRFLFKQSDHDLASDFPICEIDSLKNLLHLKILSSADTVSNLKKSLSTVHKYFRIDEGITLIQEALKLIPPIMKSSTNSILLKLEDLLKEGIKYHWTDKIKEFSIIFNYTAVTFYNGVIKVNQIIKEIDNMLNIENFNSANDKTIFEVVMNIQKFVVQIGQTCIVPSKDFLDNLNQKISKLISQKINDSLNNLLEINFFPLDNFKICLKIKKDRDEILCIPSPEQIHPLLNSALAKHMSGYLKLPIIYQNQLQSCGTFDEMVQIPYDILIKFYEKFDSISESVQQYISQFTEFSDLIMKMKNPEQLVKSFDNLLSFVDFISKLSQKNTLLSESSKTFSFGFGTVTVDSSSISALMIEFINDWISCLSISLQEQATACIEEKLSEIQESREVLEQTIPKDARHLSEYLYTFKHTNMNQVSWESLLSAIESISKFTDIQGAAKYETCLNDLNQLKLRRKKEIDSNIEQFRSLIDSESKNMQVLTEKLQEKWNNQKPLNGDILPEKAIKIIENYKIKFEKLQNALEHLNYAREIIELSSLESLTILDNMKEESIQMEQIWNSLKEIWDEFDSLTSGHIVDINDQEIDKVKVGITTLSKKIENMPNSVRQCEGWLYLFNFVKDVTSVFNQFSLFHLFKKRHWKDIIVHFSISNTTVSVSTVKGKKAPKTETIVVQVEPNNLTINQVLKTNIIKNNTFYNNLFKQVEGEATLSEHLGKIQNYWSNAVFVIENKEIISNLKSLGTMAIDNYNYLSSIQDSPYAEIYKQDVNTWTSRLQTLKNLLKLWNDTQNDLLYYKSVFTSNEIKSVLKRSTKIFQRIENDYSELLKKTELSLLSVSQTTVSQNDTKYLESFESGFNIIEKELLSYLEKQRTLFPRFFFINDSELLKILGQSSSPQKIRLWKLYQYIQSLQTSDGKIESIKTNEDSQKLLLSKPINLSPAIYKTLCDLDRGFKETLKQQLLRAIPEYQKIASSNFNHIESFISKYPQQICILAILLSPDTISSFLKVNNQNLDQSNLKVHILGMKNFINKNKIQFSFDQQTNSLNLKFGDSENSFTYGFEYFYHAEPIIISDIFTPILNNYLESQKQGKSLSFINADNYDISIPLRGISHILGLSFFIFDCSTLFTPESMSKLLTGICYVGGWCLFKNPEKLSSEVFSVLQRYIDEIHCALLNHSNELSIHNNEIPLSRNTAIFISTKSTISIFKRYFNDFVVEFNADNYIKELSEIYLSNESDKKDIYQLYNLAKKTLKDNISYATYHEMLKLHSMEPLLAVLSNNDTTSIKNIPEYNKLIKAGLKDSPNEEDFQKVLGAIIKKSGYSKSENWIGKIIHLNYLINKSASKIIRVVGHPTGGKTTAIQILLKARNFKYHSEGKLSHISTLEQLEYELSTAFDEANKNSKHFIIFDSNSDLPSSFGPEFLQIPENVTIFIENGSKPGESNIPTVLFQNNTLIVMDLIKGYLESFEDYIGSDQVKNLKTILNQCIVQWNSLKPGIHPCNVIHTFCKMIQYLKSQSSKVDQSTNEDMLQKIMYCCYWPCITTLPVKLRQLFNKKLKESNADFGKIIDNPLWMPCEFSIDNEYDEENVIIPETENIKPLILMSFEKHIPLVIVGNKGIGRHYLLKSVSKCPVIFLSHLKSVDIKFVLSRVLNQNQDPVVIVFSNFEDNVKECSNILREISEQNGFSLPRNQAPTFGESIDNSFFYKLNGSQIVLLHDQDIKSLDERFILKSTIVQLSKPSKESLSLILEHIFESYPQYDTKNYIKQILEQYSKDLISFSGCIKWISMFTESISEEIADQLFDFDRMLNIQSNDKEQSISFEFYNNNQFISKEEEMTLIKEKLPRIACENVAKLLSKLERILSTSGHVAICGDDSIVAEEIIKFLSQDLHISISTDIKSALKSALDSPTIYINNYHYNQINQRIDDIEIQKIIEDSNSYSLFSADELVSFRELASTKSSGILSIDEFIIDKLEQNLHIITINPKERTNSLRREILINSKWSEAEFIEYANSFIENDKSAITLIKLHQQMKPSLEAVYLDRALHSSHAFIKESIQKLEKERDLMKKALNNCQALETQLSQAETDIQMQQLSFDKTKSKISEIESSITAEKENINKLKADLAEAHRKCQEKQKEKALFAAKTQSEIDATRPALNEAKARLLTIKKAQIDDLKKLSSPAETIKGTLLAVMALTNNPASNWANIRKVFSEPNFLTNLSSIDFENNTADFIPLVKKANQALVASNVSQDKTSKASFAAGIMLKWVSSAVKLVLIASNQGPSRDKIEKLKEECIEMDQEEKQIQSKVSLSDQKIQKLKNDLKIAQTSLRKIETQISDLQSKSKDLSVIVENIKEKRKEWTEKVGDYNTRVENMKGDCTLAAASLSYSSIKTEKERNEDIDKFKKVFEESKMPFSSDFSLDTFFENKQFETEFLNHIDGPKFIFDPYHLADLYLEGKTFTEIDDSEISKCDLGFITLSRNFPSNLPPINSTFYAVLFAPCSKIINKEYNQKINNQNEKPKMDLMELIASTSDIENLKEITPNIANDLHNEEDVAKLFFQLNEVIPISFQFFWSCFEPKISDFAINLLKNASISLTSDELKSLSKLFGVTLDIESKNIEIISKDQKVLCKEEMIQTIPNNMKITLNINEIQPGLIGIVKNVTPSLFDLFKLVSPQ